MPRRKQNPPTQELPEPRGSVESLSDNDKGIEIRLRLVNPLDRAIHYIADVRGILYEPSTQRLRVQLSDQGRQIPPGGMAILPRFRMIDPRSEASITIQLPKTIVKLSETPSPTGEVSFEEHTLSEANEIQIEVGWADTPYYADPREKSADVSPVSSWEQQSIRIIFTPPSKRK